MCLFIDYDHVYMNGYNEDWKNFWISEIDSEFKGKEKEKKKRKNVKYL